MTAKRILVVGSANMDIVLPMRKIPREGETVLSDNYEYIPGGKGANAAVAAARLGADIVFCSRIGDDTNGKALLAAYRNERLDTRFINIDKQNATGLAAILLEENGYNRIIVYPGANMSLSPQDVENAFLSYPDALYIQFEINAATIMTAMEFARRQNIPIFVDAGPVNETLPIEHIPKLEIISPNESETYALTGIEPSNQQKCLEACIKLYTLVQTKYVVLKLSNRGCFMYDGKYCEYIPSYSVTSVDTTAAGDAFTSALTLEYLRTKNIIHACKYANVVGALTVTSCGAMRSLPSKKAVENFIAINSVNIDTKLKR